MVRQAKGERRGDPIPGSKLVREFCAQCDGPMRVTAIDRKYRPTCTDCDPVMACVRDVASHRHLAYRQRVKESITGA